MKKAIVALLFAVTLAPNLCAMEEYHWFAGAEFEVGKLYYGEGKIYKELDIKKDVGGSIKSLVRLMDLLGTDTPDDEVPRLCAHLDFIMTSIPAKKWLRHPNDILKFIEKVDKLTTSIRSKYAIQQLLKAIHKTALKEKYSKVFFKKRYNRLIVKYEVVKAMHLSSNKPLRRLSTRHVGSASRMRRRRQKVT